MLVRLATLVLCVAALSACGTADPDSGDDDARTDAADGSGADATPDATADANADAGVDAAPDTEPDDATACTTNACPCDAPADCDSGFCVQNGDAGRVCADPCGDGCDDASRCVTLDVAGTPTALCLPAAYPYCAACEDDAECGGFGSCIALADGTACATTCGADDPCPTGATCTTTTTDAGDVELCVPDAGQCTDCIDPDGDGYGVGPGCAGADCNEEDDTIHAGAAELCDGVDNDCDERVDEDFNLARDPNNCLRCGNVCTVANGVAGCNLGQCTVARCNEGFGNCNGVVEDGCEEDLTSEDFCGVCAAGSDRPGDTCGTCGSGAFACQEDGSVACEGDLEDAAFNACGGCAVLAAAPGDPCLDGGEWRCDGEEALVCVVPGEVIVTTVDDAIVDDNACSLRELILAANTGVEVDTCGVAGPDDVVRFATADATITLALVGAGEDEGRTGDLDVRVPLTIEANGATRIDGASLDRIFDVHAGGALTLIGLTLEGGVARGDAGSLDRGGVAAGAGGAIRSVGPVRLTDCSVRGSAAEGGAGGVDTRPLGGGGGGGGAGQGGAVFVDGATLTLEASAGVCVIEGNVALGGAGGNGAANGGSFSGTGAGGGGGNGGAGGSGGAGAPGGFGGGGGGGANAGGTAGGAGGFGGGGGGGGASAGGGATGPGGAPGTGGGAGGTGGCSASAGGGGGAGQGGAVFVRGGALLGAGCTLQANEASGGAAGANHFGCGTAPGAGGGYGGAVYLLDADGSAFDATYADNSATSAPGPVFEASE